MSFNTHFQGCQRLRPLEVRQDEAEVVRRIHHRLAQELKGLTLLQSLTLCLRSNSIKIEGFGALLDMSVCFPKLHSLTLNLQGNWVGAAGCAMLEEKLDAHRTRLTSLTQLSIIYEGLKLGGLWG